MTPQSLRRSVVAATPVLLFLMGAPLASAAVSVGVACPHDIEFGCVRAMVSDTFDRCDASGCWIVHEATIVVPGFTCFELLATSLIYTPSDDHERKATGCNYGSTDQEYQVSWASLAEPGGIVDLQLKAWPPGYYGDAITASWTHYADSSGYRIEYELMTRMGYLVNSNGEENPYQAPVGVALAED